MMDLASDVSVHIDELVLEGVDVSRREFPFLQAALEAELSRLLAANGLAPSLLQRKRVPTLQGSALACRGGLGNRPLRLRRHRLKANPSNPLNLC